MLTKKCIAWVLPAWVLVAGAAGARANSILFGYDVVTQGNLTTNGGDIHGLTFVGGNLTVNGASEFGADASGNGTKLWVAGNVTGSGAAQFPGSGGSALYGGTASSGIFQSGQALQGSVSLGTLGAQMTSYSSYFDSLASNSTFNNGTFSATPTTIAGLGNVAVFDVTAGQLFAQNEGLSLNVTGSPTAIIINVDGGVNGNLSTAGGQNINGAFSSDASEIIWNFYDANQSVTLANSIGWYGSILAPTANVIQSGNAINGGVYANSLTINGSGEVHSTNDLYGGPTPPGVVPLPMSVWSGAGLLGCMAIWGLVSRRAKKMRFRKGAFVCFEKGV
jgi:choice-of-anchor A domain-containing protein